MEIDLFSIISSLGFPIAMCLWFMLRTEKLVEANTSAINNLILLINKKLK